MFALSLFAVETDAPAAYVALGDERGDGAGLTRDAARLGLDDDAREPRVEWEAQHQPARLGHAACAVGRAQASQQILRRFERVRRRRFKPFELSEVADARRTQLESGLREVEASNLRRLVFGPRVEVLRCVESEAAPLARAPRAPRALHRARAAHARHIEHGQARPG